MARAETSGNSDGSDPYHLGRFVDAQRDVYAQVERELQAGRKRSHWMWFIFPQIQGLGHSPLARKYAIGSIAEARAYLDHETLGRRLRACTRLVTSIHDASIEDVFGYPDDRKFHSSMTLFAKASNGDPIFTDALAKYFNGEFDRGTLERLA